MADVLDDATVADLKDKHNTGLSVDGHQRSKGHKFMDAIAGAAEVPGQPITAPVGVSQGVLAHATTETVEKPDHHSIGRQDSSSASSNRTIAASHGQNIDLVKKSGIQRDGEQKQQPFTDRESRPEDNVDEKLTDVVRKPTVKRSFFKFGKKINAEDKKESKEDTVVSELDYSHFTEDQKAKMLAQTEMGNEDRKVTYLNLFTFATKFELLLMAFGLVCAVGAGIITPLMTVFFGDLTTAFTTWGIAIATGQDLDAPRAALFVAVDKNVRLLCFIAIALFGCAFFYMSTWIYTGQKITDRIRQAYLRAVLRQNVGWFDKMGAGEVTTRINTDTHSIQLGISEKVSVSVLYVSTFIAGFVIAFTVNWKVTIVICSIVPGIMITGAVMSVFIAKYEKQSLEAVAKGGTIAEESISSVRTVKAFNTQAASAAQYDVPNAVALKIGIKNAISFGLGMATFFFIIFAGYALTFYWGTTLLLNGSATSGQIITCFFSVLIGAFSLSMMAPNTAAIASASGAAEKVLRTIWRTPPIDSASEVGLRPSSIEGAFTLENVTFYYPSRPNVQVLDNVTLSFPKGKQSALVGPSGGGKSSIVALLMRFYDPLAGNIKLDGVDLKDLNVRWLRSRIGFVMQEPTLFSTTIWQNVSHGLIGTTYEGSDKAEVMRLVEQACKVAHAHDFITKLPEGYETQIGERGLLLSGGQKQRVAIARAIVSNPTILLLDEPTASLDSGSEAVVQKALDAASAGRTTITIAHRLSTIKGSDQIIVIGKGSVLEQGSHHDLVARKGAYAALVSAQQLRDTEGEAEDPIEQDADELLAKEAKLMESTGGQPRRADTSRSIASEIIHQKADAEANSPGTRVPGILRLMANLLKIVSDLKWYYVAGTLASIIVGMVYPVFSIVFGQLLGVYSTPDRSEIRSGGNRLALYMLITAIVSSLSMAIQSYTFAYTAQTLSRRIRLKMFQTILAQDVHYFDDSKHSTGVLTSDISSKAQHISGACGLTLGTIIQSLSTLIGGCIVGIAYSWRIALVGIALIPLTLASGLVDFYVIQLRDKHVKQVHESSAQTACEAAAAIRTVASLTREEDAVSAYTMAMEAPLRRAAKITLAANLFYGLAQAMLLFIVALMFWYGSHQLADGNLAVSDFFIALEAVVFGSLQAGQVFAWAPDVSKAKSAAAAVLALFKREIEINADSKDGTTPQDVKGLITLRDVHFRYPTRPSVRVLRGLDLTVYPGQFVALVGESGCGKSTIIQLLERFYDPLSGSVSVDGQDIRDINVKAHRSSIALVSQEPTLYEGTVRFNVSLGRVDHQATDEEIEAACKAANIHTFVMSLPDGYDTLVGGKGSQLSGGQKQRVAIARAVLRNPKILLLDEATAALDSQSEKIVQDALDAAARNRTTIAVAHRLATIQNADVIYVIRDGRVAERGTHSDLIHRKGIYFELVQQQALAA